jgi:hypothetical protein
VAEKVIAMSEVAKVILRRSSYTSVSVTVSSFEPSQDSKSSMWTPERLTLFRADLMRTFHSLELGSKFTCNLSILQPL